MYVRNQAEILLSRLKEPVSRLIVVTGPRQTGKSTLVRQVLEQSSLQLKYTYIAVDEPAAETPPGSVINDSNTNRLRPLGLAQHDIQWLVQEWEKARVQANRSEQGYILVLDEIQKIPQWSDAVKGLWDADRASSLPLHVVLLGSAPLLMQQGLSESLAGRFELVRIRHWSFLEMHQAFDFDLDSYLYFGGYPGSAMLIQDQLRWVDYIRSGLIEPNIERDILMMTRVDKPALLRRLFELGCHYSGQELSYTKMVGQLQDAGNTTTLAHYLDLLTHAGLLTGLQKYANQQHRRRASSPKLCILNTALMTALSGYTFEQANADRTFWGRLTESAVGAHLFNAGAPDIKLYYWRAQHNEVDFIIEKGRQLIAIEVKSGAGDGGRGGLDLFREQFHPHRTILVGDRGIPLETFLSTKPDDWFD